jgi:hypothetical protein
VKGELKMSLTCYRCNRGLEVKSTHASGCRIIVRIAPHKCAERAAKNEPKQEIQIEKDSNHE